MQFHRDVAYFYDLLTNEERICACLRGKLVDSDGITSIGGNLGRSIEQTHINPQSERYRLIRL